MVNKDLFYVFGILQVVSMGLIVFFVLGMTNIGKDTSIVLSVLFSVFTLIVEYMIYSKR
jgi:hypothetical protein